MFGCEGFISPEPEQPENWDQQQDECVEPMFVYKSVCENTEYQRDSDSDPNISFWNNPDCCHAQVWVTFWVWVRFWIPVLWDIVMSRSSCGC